MRRAWWVIVLCAAAVGCFARSDRTGTPVARSLAPFAPLEGVYLESVLFERPLGDRFLDDGLWLNALPVGSPETRALLSENGLRVAVVAGSLPQQFQTLLESESEAINGQRLTFSMRKEEVLPTAGPHATCKFNLLSDLAGKRTPVTFQQARCGILVRPQEMSDGRVMIVCEPQIQYGERQEWLRPTTDGTGFVKCEEVPLARYPALTFDTPLGRNEYLVIGWRASRLNTLGEALFGVETNTQLHQRVLVIRAWPVNPRNSSDLPSLGFNRSPPVAAEASRPR